MFLTQLPRQHIVQELQPLGDEMLKENSSRYLLKLLSAGRIDTCHHFSLKKTWGSNRCVSLVIGPSIWFILGQLGSGSIWWSFEDLVSTCPTEDVWKKDTYREICFSQYRNIYILIYLYVYIHYIFLERERDVWESFGNYLITLEFEAEKRWV